MSAILSLSELDASNGFVLHGIDADDWSGRSVSSPGDVNGDGIADVIIGARNASAGGQAYAGDIYIVLVSSSGFLANFDLSSLNASNVYLINFWQSQ